MIYREVATKLHRLGCDEEPRRGGGSHRKWRNPTTGQRTSLPDWGPKDLKIGTLHAAVRKLGLTWHAFEEA
ncbi:MAG TPA: type II toxin-antitoxin system HicA family toxin [Candidatus Saccharimonadia bacterium]|nr:type II toxin-antitoxin system HicA family toxin [Candidatus Saccharimonadia bacterium]